MNTTPCTPARCYGTGLVLKWLLGFFATATLLFAQTTILDLGSRDAHAWSSRVEHNKGFVPRSEYTLSLQVEIGNYAQANWNTTTALDLSAHASQAINIVGDLTNTTGENFRLYLYDGTGGLAVAEFTASFSSSMAINQSDWLLDKTDLFGVTGTGSFDWSNVIKAGLSCYSTGSVTVDIQEILLGPVPTPYAPITIADFGTTKDHYWDNRVEHNYGFSGRQETDDTFYAIIGGYAQANWNTTATLDLSDHATQPISIVGDLISTGSPFRLWLYDASGGLVAFEKTDSFETVHTINQGEWNYYPTDAFGNSGMGSFDWSSVTKFGLRTNASSPVQFLCDTVILGEMNLPPRPFKKVVVGDFGTEKPLQWDDKIQYNYGWSSRTETTNTLTATIGNYAQASWNTLTSLDLSEHDQVEMSLVGNVTNPTGESFRLFLYDGSGGMAGVNMTSGFTGKQVILYADWNYYMTDAFGVSGSGSFDWGNVVKFAFRTNSSGSVTATIDHIVLGAYDVPPPPCPEQYAYGSVIPFTGATQREEAILETNFTFPDHALNAADWNSPIVTFNNHVFYTYIDTNMDISVYAQYADGTTDNVMVIPNVTDDDHHVEPSIGVDENGFLHVMGNMHNTPPIYYRSSNPCDISAWTEYGNDGPNGGIPLEQLTYQNFFNHPDGSLFMSGRSNVYVDWFPGRQAGVILRYNAETRLWTVLGTHQTKWPDTDLFYVDTKAVVWDDSGSGTPPKNGYQGYKLRTRFDANGRLHMSWNVAKNPDHNGTWGISANHTHLLYAYSDDKGLTWHQADGSAVALPLGTTNVSPIYVSPTESLYNNSLLGLTSDNRPIVGNRDNDISAIRWFEWDGVAWVNFENRSDELPGLIATCPYGTINVFNINGIQRSWDNGATWEVYDFPVSTSSYQTIPDYDYIAKTGKIRFSKGYVDAQVYTIHFADAPMPIGGPLEIMPFTTLPNAEEQVAYSYDIPHGGGDGIYAFSVVSGSLPSGLALSPAGTISGTPATLTQGMYAFTLQLIDNSAETTTLPVTLTVDPYNTPPVAHDDTHSTAFDTALTVPAPGVLGNDTDAESAPLTVNLGSVTAAANGTVDIGEDGSFTYTPTSGFSGDDSFTYQANDGSADSNVATVTVTVEPAVVGSLSATSVAQDKSVQTLTASGYDDWCFFGWTTSQLQVRKAGANIIGAYQIIGQTPVTTYTYSTSNDYPWDRFSFADGDDPVSLSRKTACINVTGVVGEGLSIDVPADTVSRRVTIWTSGWESEATFTASLSDGNVSDYSTTLTPHNPHNNFHMTRHVIEYNAASDGETLTLSIVKDLDLDTSQPGNVKINAIALEDL